MKNCLTAHPRKPTQSSASMKSLHVWHAAQPPVEIHGSSFGSGVSKSGHSYDHFTSSDEQKSQIVTRLGKMSLGIFSAPRAARPLRSRTGTGAVTAELAWIGRLDRLLGDF